MNLSSTFRWVLHKNTVHRVCECVCVTVCVSVCGCVCVCVLHELHTVKATGRDFTPVKVVEFHPVLRREFRVCADSHSVMHLNINKARYQVH